jgi:hypothetical protein
LAFPPNFTNNWDITFPPDTQLANLLGQDLRNLRVDVMQRMSLLSGTLANRPAPETVNATWGGAGFGLLYFATDTSQIFQWNGAAWVDVSSSFRGVVAKVDLTAQSANIVSTLLFTPTANGFYRISPWLMTTQAATTSSTLPNLTIGFTDADSSFAELISVTGTSTANTIGQAGLPSTVLPFYAKSGVNITYQTNNYASVGGTSLQYSLHIRLEFLG